MSKIVRWEFMGSPFLFWFLCITIILIPAAVIYMVNSTLKIENELDDPEKFIEHVRAGKPAKE